MITGATFVVMSAIKIATMGGVGIGIVTGIQYFMNFELPKKKKGGEESDHGESLKQRVKQIG